MPVETLTDVRQISLELLLPHPKNANVVPKAVMKKLRRHIERTGRYEPLVVRPHPGVAGSFELINGHHRKEILAALGHRTAACLVWELDDAETLMLLATINRLGGEDAAGKRFDLLEALAAEVGDAAEKLAGMLPENAATLKRALANAPLQPISEPPSIDAMPEAFTVFMRAADKRRLMAALKRTDADPAAALLRWAEGK